MAIASSTSVRNCVTVNLSSAEVFGLEYMLVSLLLRKAMVCLIALLSDGQVYNNELIKKDTNQTDPWAWR